MSSSSRSISTAEKIKLRDMNVIQKFSIVFCLLVVNFSFLIDKVDVVLSRNTGLITLVILILFHVSRLWKAKQTVFLSFFSSFILCLFAFSVIPTISLLGYKIATNIQAQTTADYLTIIKIVFFYQLLMSLLDAAIYQKLQSSLVFESICLMSLTVDLLCTVDSFRSLVVRLVVVFLLQGLTSQTQKVIRKRLSLSGNTRFLATIKGR